MAFTTLIADSFQGSGNLNLSPATNGAVGAFWYAGDSAGSTSCFARSPSGATLPVASPGYTELEYYVSSSPVTVTLTAAGLTFEAAVYGAFDRLRFDGTRISSVTTNDGRNGTLVVGVDPFGDVYVDVWGSNIPWTTPVTNIGTISPTTLTIVQVFRFSNSFSVKINGTTVFTYTPYIGNALLPNALPTLSSGTVMAVAVAVFFSDTDFFSSTGAVGGPTEGGPVISYIHVASGVPTGTYLGSPPFSIYATCAVETAASATLISPPRPPDVLRSYPFQNFVAWNEVSSHTVALRDVRPHKLSRTAVSVRSAAALSGDGQFLAIYVVGGGDRWVSGGLMRHTLTGWAHCGVLPERTFPAGGALALALDGTGRRMMCATSTGWELYKRDLPSTTFVPEQGAMLPGGAVSCALDSRGITAAVLTATQALIYTCNSPLDLFLSPAVLALPGVDTWTNISLSGDGKQLFVAGAAHSLTFTRTGDAWGAAATPDFTAVFAAVNTDGTLATHVSGGTLITVGLQNARLSTTTVTPGPTTAGGVALTSAITGTTQASEVFMFALSYSQALPAAYGLCDGAAVLGETTAARTFTSAGSPLFAVPAQRSQQPNHSGFWMEPVDEIP